MQSRFLRRVAQLLRDGAAVAALLLSAHAAADGSTEYLSRPDVRSFIEAMQAEHGLELAELERVLGEAQYQPSVVRLIGPVQPQPGQPVRSYPAYRSRFLTPRASSMELTIGRCTTHICVGQRKNSAFHRK